MGATRLVHAGLLRISDGALANHLATWQRRVGERERDNPRRGNFHLCYYRFPGSNLYLRTMEPLPPEDVRAMHVMLEMSGKPFFGPTDLV